MLAEPRKLFWGTVEFGGKTLSACTYNVFQAPARQVIGAGVAEPACLKGITQLYPPAWAVEL